MPFTHSDHLLSSAFSIGYSRVSTNGQDLALQQEALKAARCENVYAEKISGARSDRPQLARMLKALRPGDTVVVTRLDRLARSTLDLLRTVDVISKAGASARWQIPPRRMGS
jgi:DNA invertase Pin-like site-specific DNA recombinase